MLRCPRPVRAGPKPPRSPRARAGPLLVTALALAALVAGCGGANPAAGANDGGRIRVVAAENFWGSVAAQLAGSRGQIQSIVTDPAADPHSYEPKTADAIALAGAGLVIVNGAGYDPWAPKLLAASPSGGRTVLTVGNLLGLHQGDNPHRWYNPADVGLVARAITAGLKRQDPHHAAYFDAQLIGFQNKRLARYHGLIASIRSRYSGVPVGASESIFAPLAPALGLRLLTPDSFMRTVSEGAEVSARDSAATQAQILGHAIKVWIYNSQNATPQIQELNRLARAAGVSTATVTETLSPAGVSFEDWQSAQLRRLAQALHQATGR